MTDGPAAPPPVPTGTKSIIDRVRDILLKPKDEWGVIEAQQSTVQGIYTGYVLILAAIAPVCMLIGQQLIGVSYGIVSVKPSIAYSIVQAILYYGATVGSVYVMGLVIDALAPTFEGVKNKMNAFKLAAYAPTAAWLGGILFIIPKLGVLSFIAAIYSLYLLYLGLPRLMKVKEDKALAYVGVTIFVQFLIMAIVFVLASEITGALVPMHAAATVGDVRVSF